MCTQNIGRPRSLKSLAVFVSVDCGDHLHRNIEKRLSIACWLPSIFLGGHASEGADSSHEEKG